MSTDAQLDRVLDSAYACFTRHGVRRTTMDDIAREAGMSRPAVYLHVRNKEDAFDRLVRRLLDASLADAAVAALAPGTLADRLTGALERKLDLTLRLWRDSPAHAAELLGSGTRASAALIDSYAATLRDRLADAIRADRPGADAVELAEVLLALTRGLEFDLSDPDAPRRRLHSGVALLVAGLEGSTPATPATPATSQESP